MRYPALRHRAFATLWLALFVSNVGTWIHNVAQSWLLYRLSGNSTLHLGWLGLCFALPMVLLPPFGGIVADRIVRARGLLVTQGLSMLLALALAVLTWTHVLRPSHILLSTFLGAVVLAFDNPLRQSFMPDLVPRAALQNAVSLTSATFTGAALVGPGIAGLLLERVNAGWLFLINALSFVTVMCALSTIRLTETSAREPTTPRSTVTFLRSSDARNVLALLLLSGAAAMLARSYQQLLPVFADGLAKGPRSYGALLQAAGGGALVGAVSMSLAPQIESKVRLTFVSALALSLALVAFACSRSIVAALLCVCAIGAASTVLMTMIVTQLQLGTPAPFRGRVMSLYVTTLIGLPALGSLGMAALAERMTGPVGPLRSVSGAVVLGAGSFAIVTCCWRGLSGQGLSRRSERQADTQQRAPNG